MSSSDLGPTARGGLIDLCRSGVSDVRHTDATEVDVTGAAASMFHLHDHRSKPSRSKEGYWDSVARIGVQIANALAYANCQGVSHRDIKPPI